MLIGLISDTHGRLRPEVFRHFEGVDRILHAGDIGDPGILVELQTLAPVTAVWGNTDGFDVRARVPEFAWLELEGRRLLVLHGHQLGSPEPAGLRAAYPDAAIIVYGHTHKALVDESDGRLVVNPGAAGPARFGVGPTIALLSLTPSAATVRFVEL
jgi:putative phosphoesterase